jgi:hypothetical protein
MRIIVAALDQSVGGRGIVMDRDRFLAAHPDTLLES